MHPSSVLIKNFLKASHIPPLGPRKCRQTTAGESRRDASCRLSPRRVVSLRRTVPLRGLSISFLLHSFSTVVTSISPFESTQHLDSVHLAAIPLSAEIESGRSKVRRHSRFEAGWEERRKKRRKIFADDDQRRRSPDENRSDGCEESIGELGSSRIRGNCNSFYRVYFFGKLF